MPVAVLAVFTACSGDKDKDAGNGMPAIELMGQADAVVDGDVSANTRAITEFPNNKQIGVISTAPTDQTDIYFYNKPATGTYVPADNRFDFGWPSNNVQYWPFNDSKLVFFAYSPVADETKAANSKVVVRKDNGFQLDIYQKASMPDVMVASNNTVPTVYRKTDKLPVDLGEFSHLLSKLTVNVVRHEDGYNTAIRLTGLTLTIPSLKVTHDIMLGQTTAAVVESATPITDVIINSSTSIGTGGVSHMRHLMKECADELKLKIKLTDGIFTFEQEYSLADFTKEGGSGTVGLKPGEHTVLTFKVKSVPVTDPLEIELKAKITEWKDKGKYVVGIN